MPVRDLVAAFHELLENSASGSGPATDAAQVALDRVNFSAPLTSVEPQSSPVIDMQLARTCNSGNKLADATLAASDQLDWRSTYKEWDNEPDMGPFIRNHAFVCLIGDGCPVQSDNVAGGLYFQGRDIFYPAHAHQAVESYWIIGGDGDWKVGTDPWFPVKPGTEIHHNTGTRHAMQTNHAPMLTAWLWTTHIDSGLVLVRG